MLVHPLPDVKDRLVFLYHFDEPNLDRINNDRGYQRLLPRHEYDHMVRTHNFGCFGNMFMIEHDAIKELNLLNMIPNIQSK